MSQKSRSILMTLGFFMAGIFLGLSWLVHKDYFRSVDYNAMIGFQDFISRSFDLPFSYITLLGSTEVVTALLIIVFISILIIKRQLFLGLFLYFLIFLVELAGKVLIFHPDPPPLFGRDALDFRFPSTFMVRTGFSYPSGHVSRSVFLTIILLYLISKAKSIWYKKIFFTTFLLTYIVLVFISRIYLGEHWFSDVLGGIILGISISVFAISFW